MIDRHLLITTQASAGAGRRGVDGTWLEMIFSFELVFAMFLYSNAFSFFLAYFHLRPPVDETLLFAGVGAMAAAWIVWRQGLSTRALPLLAAYLLFVGWTILSMGWSPSRTLARQTVLYELTFLLWALTGAALVVATRRERIARFLILIGVISVALSLLGWTLYLFFGSFKSYMNAALTETGLGESRAYNRVGYAVAFGSIVLFTIASFARFGSLRQILAGAAFALTCSFLFVAGSRGAFLSTVAGCLIIVLLLYLPLFCGNLRLKKTQLFAIIIFVTIVIGLIIALSLGLQSTTLERLNAFILKAQNPELIQKENRIRYFKLAIYHWTMNPFFGLGNSGFNMLSGRGEMIGYHPHNIILEILVNYGIVGFILFISFLWTAFRYVTLNRLLSDNLLLAVFGLFLVGFIAAQGSQQFIRHDILIATLGLLLMPAAAEVRSSALRPSARPAPAMFRRHDTAPVPIVRTRS